MNAKTQLLFMKAHFFFAQIPNCAADQKSIAFLGLPKWYEYLPYNYSQVTQRCEIQVMNASQYWLIGFAVLDALLRIATLVAIGFVVWGGIQFVSSQGEPDKTTAARNTLINALIGLVIAVSAATLVSFVGRKISS